MKRGEGQHTGNPAAENSDASGEHRFLDDDGGLITRVRRLVTPICESMGLELVYIEFQRENKGRVLRLYLDSDGGVGINDCTRVSRQASDLLDVYLEDDDAYTLEVSSAGIDRLLGRVRDFERFAGKTAIIKTSRLVEGRKRFKGVLLGMSEDRVAIEVDRQRFEVPYAVIAKAQLVNDDGVDQW
ncbi:MAG: ribosome maturation factor RimP [Desulfosudaceae bacterium]